jgi:putative phosphoesterase
MRIGIISDSHDQHERTRVAVQFLLAQGAERLFHCGDLTRSEIVDICALLPCYFVFGNNDAGRVAELRAAIARAPEAVCLEWGGVVELDRKRIAVTQGHQSKECRRLLASGPDYLFSGHTHVAADQRDDVTRRINPGALHRASPWTVALLDLKDDNLTMLTIPHPNATSPGGPVD